MGSLGVFAALLLLQIILCPFMYLVSQKWTGTEECMRRWKCGPLYARLAPMAVILATQAFLLGAYMELVISCMLSTRMLGIRAIWKWQDKVAFGFNVVFSVATIGFTCLIVWFVCKYVNGLIALRRLEYLD